MEPTVLYLLAALALLLAARHGAERFASPEATALAGKAAAVFAVTDDYAPFRAAVRRDPVLHHDALRLWRRRRLTPETMQSILE